MCVLVMSLEENNQRSPLSPSCQLHPSALVSSQWGNGKTGIAGAIVPLEGLSGEINVPLLPFTPPGLGKWDTRPLESIFYVSIYGNRGIPESRH